MTSVPARPLMIAYRKACRPTGVGLSHYVMLTNPAPRENPSDTTSTQ
jgi:modified peptide precursor CbpA